MQSNQCVNQFLEKQAKTQYTRGARNASTLSNVHVELMVSDRLLLYRKIQFFSRRKNLLK